MRRFSAIGLCVLVVLIGATIMLVKHGSRISSTLYLAGCETYFMGQTSVSGVGTFSVVHLACDHGEKEEYVDVYACGNAKDASHWWSNQGTLIFRYDPKNSQVPTIKGASKTQIVISIPTVSSVAIKVEQWRAMNIRYKIGHTDYP